MYHLYVYDPDSGEKILFRSESTMRPLAAQVAIEFGDTWNWLVEDDNGVLQLDKAMLQARFAALLDVFRAANRVVGGNATMTNMAGEVYIPRRQYDELRMSVQRFLGVNG